MSLFEPVFRFDRVWEITPEWTRARGFSVLLLDVDNTLTTHDNPAVPAEVRGWIARMQAADIRLLILSNNQPARVEPFARALGLSCIANARKPLGGGIRRARERFGVKSREIAVIGDQIFTDVLCANCAGACSVLVEPMELEHFPFFKFKRRLERVLLKNYDSRAKSRAANGRFHGTDKD